MNLCNFRNPLVACAVAASMLATPSNANAFCCLFDWCCKPRATTFAAVPAPAPAFQQQVSYVPQTCYRTVYTNVPVTTMRPVTTTDPCTGCPVTCMRPETTYVQRPQVVPYTQYRPVVTQVPVNPCPPPAATYYQPAQAAPNCCAPATTSTIVTPGPTTNGVLAPPGTSIGPPTQQPSLPQGTTTPPTTFQSLQSSAAPRTFAPDPSMKPLQETSQGSTVAPSNAPRLLDPNDRTTMRPMPRPWAISPAVLNVTGSTMNTSAQQPAPAVDSDGWHAAQ